MARKAWLMAGFCLLILGPPRVGAQQVEPAFFGMGMNHAHQSGRWPSVPFGSLRLWDTGVSWKEIERQPGTYDFSLLDRWLSLAESQGTTDVLYTFGKTPEWCRPAGTKARTPPADLGCWDRFVTAIVRHAHGRIRSWELWNEPNLNADPAGEVATFVEMARRASRIIKGMDPRAIVVSPSAAYSGPGRPPVLWVRDFLAHGGGAYVDAIAFHGYKKTVPEEIAVMVSDIRQAMQAHGIGGKPLWDTESNWTQNGLSDPDAQAAFLARSYLVQLESGVQRFYWYSWDNEQGWGALSQHGKATKAGRAYGELYRWLVGAVARAPCSQTGEGTWSCAFRLAGGRDALIVWNTAGARSYSPGSQYTVMRNLEGGEERVLKQIEIGPKPLLLVAAASPGYRAGR
jgi:hypothetical protein